MIPSSSALVAVKSIHTLAWVILAACVIGLPFAAQHARFGLAASLIAVVGAECVVLALNRWACPLTAVAARYTQDRQANFDIFLPLWLARYNKQIFGPLFVAGLLYTALQWWRH